MEQLSIFTEAGQSARFPQQLIEYIPGFIEPFQSKFLLQKFICEAHWEQQVVKMYDKEVITPRLNAWFGDVQPGNPLTKKIPTAKPWTPELLAIKNKVTPLAALQFNAVLLNYYRDANDSVAWHSDKEAAPGTKTVVASVSLGQVRSFDIRNKHDHAEKYSLRLEDGSFLLMKAGLQDHWEHRIAKSTKPMKARINLTFRVVG